MWQLGVNFQVMAKATKFIIPVRMVYEWKSCPANKVPALENNKNFPDKFPEESGGRIFKDDSDILQEVSKYYGAFPNIGRVWLCATAKVIFSLELTSTIGDIEKLLSSLGIFEIEPFVANMIPSLFPMCVYDATKSYKAQAY
jgi:hypothetical protein